MGSGNIPRIKSSGSGRQYMMALFLANIVLSGRCVFSESAVDCSTVLYYRVSVLDRLYYLGMAQRFTA